MAPRKTKNLPPEKPKKTRPAKLLYPPKPGSEAEKKVGKPDAREFDQQLFENLCHVWCTIEELEHILQSDMRTMDVWCRRTYNQTFSEAYERLSCNGKASLRRNQFNLSKTNATMGIWLGKQKLGQKEDVKPAEGFGGELKDFVDFLKQKYDPRPFAQNSADRPEEPKESDGRQPLL